MPTAATHPEVTLPAPSGWPGSEAFPRTSGTGRLDAGGLFWTDFIYDDHGAIGTPGGDPAESGAPSFGTYTYPPGPAANNGADIFRAAVTMTPTATIWRVDWNTLADQTVPIAEWTFDTDHNSVTGGSAWPAGAGVSSPGIDRALTVSSQGARLLDVASGQVLATLPVTVDMAARSFVVAVPRCRCSRRGVGSYAWLPAWLTLRAPALPGPAVARCPTEPAIYNVAFRTVAQESAYLQPLERRRPGRGPDERRRQRVLSDDLLGRAWPPSGRLPSQCRPVGATAGMCRRSTSGRAR